MDNDVLKVINVNKDKSRDFLVMFLVTVVVFGACLFYAIYQSYNYEGYPTTDIKNVNTATNNDKSTEKGID